MCSKHGHFALGKMGNKQMDYFTKDEQCIINQATEILDSKLKIKNVCDNVFLIRNYLRIQMEQCQREHMSAFYLNTQLRLIEYKVVFSGGVKSCTISAREFAKDALQLNATAIVLAHNHPSGESMPSPEDIKATLKIREALELFEINLIDHFVVGHNEISSMRELNLI